jgi:competence protein ComEA
MGQIETETTQDDFEGSIAPLGLSRSTSTTDGTWAPIIRKLLGIVFGAVVLSFIGALSNGYSPNRPSTVHAAAPGVEPLEWLALSAPPPREIQPLPGGESEGPAATSHSSPLPEPLERRTPAVPSSAPGSPDNVPKQSGGILPDGRVVLNIATVAELQTLPGIGQKRAESIIALRERLGGLKKLSDLLRVKGIGVKSLRKLGPKVTLNPELSPGGANSTADMTSPAGSKEPKP